MRDIGVRLFVVGSKVAMIGVVSFLATGCAGSGAAAFGQGLTSPLDDLNLRQSRLPRVLVDADRDPYGDRNTGRCGAIAQEVRALDGALGPDRDEPPPPSRDGDLAARAAGELIVGLAIDTATDFIPVRGWIRQLSGAEQHSREVQTAVQSGRQRRAYLKGVGMRMDCAPPAAPSWYQPGGYQTAQVEAEPRRVVVVERQERESHSIWRRDASRDVAVWPPRQVYPTY